MANSTGNLLTGLLQGIAQGQQFNFQRKQKQEEKDRREKKDKLARKLQDLDLEDRQITRRRQEEELQLKKDQFKSKQDELGKAALLKEQNRDFLKNRFPNIFGTSAPASPQQAPLAIPGQGQPVPRPPQLGPSAGEPLPAQPPQLGSAPAQQPGQAPVTTFDPANPQTGFSPTTAKPLSILNAFATGDLSKLQQEETKPLRRVGNFLMSETKEGRTLGFLEVPPEWSTIDTGLGIEIRDKRGGGLIAVVPKDIKGTFIPTPGPDGSPVNILVNQFTGRPILEGPDSGPGRKLIQKQQDQDQQLAQQRKGPLPSDKVDVPVNPEAKKPRPKSFPLVKRELPLTVGSEMGEVASIIESLNMTEKAHRENPEFFGVRAYFYKGAAKIPFNNSDSVRNAVSAHTTLQSIFSIIGKIRSGAVLNKEEIKRLENEIPRATDSPAEFTGKLAGFRSTLLRAMRARVKTYNSQNFRVNMFKDALNEITGGRLDPSEQDKFPVLKARGLFKNPKTGEPMTKADFLFRNTPPGETLVIDFKDL